MATPGNLASSVLASKTKTKKKHFVAQKVKLFRASDPLLSVLMWGVNHSVSLLCGALLLLLRLSLSSSASLAATAVAGRGPLAGWLGRSRALRLLPSPGAPNPTTCVHPLGFSSAACAPFGTQDGCGMRSVPCASEPLRACAASHPSSRWSVPAAREVGSLCGDRLRLSCQPRRENAQGPVRAIAPLSGTDRPVCPEPLGRCTCPSLSGSVRSFPRENWSEPEDFGRQLESVAFFFPLKAVLSDSMRNFFFLFFCNGKRQHKYGPDAERLRPFPHRQAAVPAPDLLAGSPPPHLGEPGRSHRLRKGSQGGDRRRGTRRARVGGGLELITSV